MGSGGSTQPFPSSFLCLLHSLQASSRCFIVSLSFYEVILTFASSTLRVITNDVGLCLRVLGEAGNQILLTLGLSLKCLPYFFLNGLLCPSCLSDESGHSGFTSSVPSRKPALIVPNLYGLSS